MQGDHDPYAALRHRDYRHLLAGSILASVGTEAQAVAVGWELYRRTNSASALGLVGLVQFLPVLLLSLPAGQVADRWSRKGLLLVAQGTAMLASLGLAALSLMQGPVRRAAGWSHRSVADLRQGHPRGRPGRAWLAASVSRSGGAGDGGAAGAPSAAAPGRAGAALVGGGVRGNDGGLRAVAQFRAV